MSSGDFVELAAQLLACWAVGFGSGALYGLFVKVTEQV